MTRLQDMRVLGGLETSVIKARKLPTKKTREKKKQVSDTEKDYQNEIEKKKIGNAGKT